jgi:chromosome segregation ATPase
MSPADDRISADGSPPRAVIFLAPHVAKALTAIAGSIGPALAELQKQRDDIRKGSLTEKLEDALHLLKKADAERAEATAAAAEASLKVAEANERLEALAEQNAKLQKAVEEDRSRTEDANKKLHEIRGEFQVATLQHQEQRQALIAQVGALTESLEAARREIAEFHQKEDAKLHVVATDQARQDVAISETRTATVKNTAAIGQNSADIDRLKQGSSGEMPVVKIDPKP